MHHQWVSWLLLSGLAIALLLAAFTDLQRRQIDNALNAAIALGAPLFWWAGGTGWPAIGEQVVLAVAGFALLCGLFALRIIGGGDAKLLGALALWFPPAAFARLVTAMALLGGALTVAMAAWHLARASARRNTAGGKTGMTVPYGVAIAGAGLWVLTKDYWPPR